MGCAEFLVSDYLSLDYNTLAEDKVTKKQYYKADIPARQLYTFVEQVANALNSKDVRKMRVRHCALGDSKDRCEQFCRKFCVKVEEHDADLNYTANIDGLI